MTDLETREDDWARGVFDRVRTGQHEPHWTPDATTAARQSSRRRRQTRLAGALTTAAVVGVSITAFGTLGGSTAGPPAGTPVVPPEISEHQFSPPKDAKPIVPASDLSKYLNTDIGYSDSADVHTGLGHTPPLAAATIGTVLSGIDPGLAHVRPDELRVTPLAIGPEAPGAVDSVAGWGLWAPDGDISQVLNGRQDLSKALGSVTITMWSNRIAAQEQDRPTVACGLEHAVFVPGYLMPTAWSPCAQQTQSDGSVITTTHSVGAVDGDVLVAARRFPNGSMVVAAASSVLHYSRINGVDPLLGPGAAQQPNVTGLALNPVPWTDNTLGDALSGPDVKGLN